MAFSACSKQHSVGVKWAVEGRGDVVHYITRQWHHRIWNTEWRLWSISAAPIASYDRGLSPFRTASTRLGHGQQWCREQPGTWHLTAQIAAAPRAHGKVGVLSLVLGVSKAGAQLAGCFGRLQTAACSPSLPPSDLAHPAETWRTTARACSKLLQPLPRSGFAETTQHLLHPPLHPGMCCPALTRGLLLLSTAPFPLPAGVSCLTSPKGRPQQDLRAPTRSSGPRFLTCSVVQGEGEEQGEQQDSPCREHGGCVVALPLSSVPPCPLSAAVALAAPSFILCLPPTRAAFPKISDLFSVARVKGVSGGFFWDASSGGWKSLRSSSAFYRTAMT